MNAPFDKRTRTNMTSKGQVLIPKAVRDAVGLSPGAAVDVGVDDRGRAVVERAGAPEESHAMRKARLRAAMEKVAGTLRTGFATTDEYMDHIRPWRHDPL